MTAIIVGNSHVAALKRGADRISGADQVLRIAPFGDGNQEYIPFSKVTDGRVEFSTKYSAGILRNLLGLNFFDPRHVWGICMGTHTGRICSRDVWRRSAPSRLASGSVRPISEDVMAEIFEKELVHVKEFISQLEQAKVKVFVVSCPNPRRNGAAAKAGIPLKHISEIDSMARAHFARWLSDKGIPMVTPPEETIDPDGFLKSEFDQEFDSRGNPDPHHANADYGELMVRKILVLLGSSPRLQV